MMKKLISFVSICLCITTAQGQYVADALRFSQNFPTLTARSMAMGNAFTSLGADFSSAYTNPAGLGLYRKSEILFSPGMGYSNIKADYIGQQYHDDQYQYINSSVGYVGTYNSSRQKGLISASLAAGYNRLNNFYNNTFIQGTNELSSFSDQFVEYASENHLLPDELDPFYERLAYDGWVIDTFEYMDQYKSMVPVPIDQRKSIHTQGGTGEWSFAIGLNFSNIIYFGTGIGIDQLNYEQHAVLSEYNYDNYWAFRSFDFTEDLDVKGTGVNFKFGLLARISNSIRLGATLFLPTYYNIEEVYYNTLYSEYDDSSFFIRPTNEYGDLLEAGVFGYNLNTPMKVNGGMSFQIGKTGIISGDVEYINYAGIKMSTDDSYNTSDDRQMVEEVNSAIDDTYRSVCNFKLGAEFRLGNFALRAGGGYYPSPYSSNELNSNASYTEITSGVGYRDRFFFFDLGFSGIFHKEKYNLYTSNNTNNIADLSSQAYRFIATMGLRF
jgi:hypothetical protein